MHELETTDGKERSTFGRLARRTRAAPSAVAATSLAVAIHLGNLPELREITGSAFMVGGVTFPALMILNIAIVAMERESRDLLLTIVLGQFVGGWRWISLVQKPGLWRHNRRFIRQNAEYDRWLRTAVSQVSAVQRRHGYRGEKRASLLQHAWQIFPDGEPPPKPKNILPDDERWVASGEWLDQADGETLRQFNRCAVQRQTMPADSREIRATRIGNLYEAVGTKAIERSAEPSLTNQDIDRLFEDSKVDIAESKRDEVRRKRRSFEHRCVMWATLLGISPVDLAVAATGGVRAVVAMAAGLLVTLFVVENYARVATKRYVAARLNAVRPLLSNLTLNSNYRQ